MLKDTKVLLWDVDGTLVTSAALMPAIHEAQKRVIARELAVTIEEANRLWEEQKPNYDSTTQLTAFLIHKNVVETGVLVEELAQKWRVTNRDERLVAMFGRLTHFTHYICGNGSKEGITNQLIALGLDPKIFKNIFSIDVAGKPKPDPAMFHLALADTGLPPSAHLMIGDRLNVDILPSKALGIQTCLIGEKNDAADVCIDTVYDVENVLK